jgi:putative ABC transport system substrate-binding protein
MTTSRLAGMVVLGLGLHLATPATEAQLTAKIRRVGYLTPGGGGCGLTSSDTDLFAFRERLGQLGWIEGKNVAIECRHADGKFERLPALAAELVALGPEVIVTITTPGALAAKQATSTIPIVMAGSADPVKRGLIQSLARPGGNVTGLTNVPGPGFVGKQLQLLRDIAPRMGRVAMLMNPDFAPEVDAFDALLEAGRSLALTPVKVEVRSPDTFDPATLAASRPNALFVAPNYINWRHRKVILEFAATHRLPAMYGERDWVEAGGLMSYFTNWLDLRRRAAVYVDRILRGAKPADLPVEEPVKFELVLNLKTARALGLTVPPALLVQANEVIE